MFFLHFHKYTRCIYAILTCFWLDMSLFFLFVRFFSLLFFSLLSNNSDAFRIYHVVSWYILFFTWPHIDIYCLCVKWCLIYCKLNFFYKMPVMFRNTRTRIRISTWLNLKMFPWSFIYLKKPLENYLYTWHCLNWWDSSWDRRRILIAWVQCITTLDWEHFFIYTPLFAWVTLLLY